MLGFSVYLDQSTSDNFREYVKDMKDSGFSEIYTTTCIPKLADHLTDLNYIYDLSKEFELHMTMKVDCHSYALIDNDILNDATLLIDDEALTNGLISHINNSNLAINASTITSEDLHDLKMQNVDLFGLNAWYNYYPHPNTGLDLTWLAQKNHWLHKHHMKTSGFVTGSKPFSDPLNEGLPTLERHRSLSPFIAAVELSKLETDNIIIGDSYSGPELRKSFKSFFVDGVIPLHMTNMKIGVPDCLFKMTFHNRKDPSRDVIRLAESHKMKCHHFDPTNNIERVFGSVTMDNINYGPYTGEVQIVCRHLPASQRVNVLGEIITSDLKLLSYIDAGTAFKIIPR
ncbi:MupG family TIM beta-alpha barrel fold protein [Companilactobacillus hulinensis]|uniref:MupG family TIM beta-alpha barrel fold protein n=1 Tax=Companilactobacillus hulinensis TaxID=2486007 RepID=UPI000F79C0FF|nr:MupG family TIM beta-alpha barrel fold protein [Companilactobacillus hulinensis]